MMSEKMQEEEPMTKPLKIMLFGKGGVGKSSSGNTILGRYEFKSDMSVKRVTKHCGKGEGTVSNVPVDDTGTVVDVPVVIIDTPGLFETEHKEETVRKILKSVELQEPGPQAFVLVVPVGRMTQEDQDTQAQIEAMFGPRVWDYTIVLFTHGDRLERKTINDVISESDENLRNFMRKCSGGFHVFNNKDPQDQKQVSSLIAKIQTLVALNGNKKRSYHTDLYPAKEQKLRRRQEVILKERAKEIQRKERELRERYQGKELEDAKRRLWWSEEDNARTAAEKEIEWPIIVIALSVITLVGLAFGKIYSILLLVAALILIYFMVPSVQNKLKKVYHDIRDEINKYL